MSLELLEAENWTVHLGDRRQVTVVSESQTVCSQEWVRTVRAQELRYDFHM